MKLRISVKSGLAVAAATFISPYQAQAQAPSVVDVCSGLSVNLPVLQPVAGATSGLLAGLLDPVLNSIIGNVNLNLRDALSGRNIGVSVLDRNGNAVTAPGNCALQTNGVTVTNPGGITIGGGAITGLGSPSSLAASAPDQNAIAFGNGASSTAGTLSGIAIGLRGTVTALDGVAIGRDATVTASNGVAIGSGSQAARGGLSGASETFTNVAVTSSMGAVSVGATGAERQITNLAGGTQNTDAVNLRQLKAVGNSLAGSMGGGANFNSTTGAFTGPTYNLRGGIYTDVGAALAALDTAIGPGPVNPNPPSASNGAIATNNTSNNPVAVAAGQDTLAVGYGSASTGARSTAVGTLARSEGDGSIAFGPNALATGSGAVATGDRAAATGSGSVAIGNNAAATGTDSIALGRGASAQPAGAVAIGAGATATRANQVAIGTVTNTYTMRGINSDSSKAAQSGPTQIVTTDAAGNLASVSFDPRAFDQRLTAVGQDVAALRNYAVESRKEARQGIAAAMAMTGAAMPSAPGRTSWSSNTGVYKGEWAAGVAIAHRLNVAIPVAVSASASWSANSFGGARVGVSGEF